MGFADKLLLITLMIIELCTELLTLSTFFDPKSAIKITHLSFELQIICNERSVGVKHEPLIR